MRAQGPQVPTSARSSSQVAGRLARPSRMATMTTGRPCRCERRPDKAMPGGNDCAARHRLAACLTPSGLARRAPCACRPLPLHLRGLGGDAQAGGQPARAGLSVPPRHHGISSAASGLAAASTASVTTSRTCLGDVVGKPRGHPRCVKQGRASASFALPLGFGAIGRDGDRNDEGQQVCRRRSWACSHGKISSGFR